MKYQILNIQIKNAKIFLFLLFIFAFLFFIFDFSYAATNISSTSTEHFAWNDAIGWIDFYATNNVNVENAQLVGYASSSVGAIALNCNSTPNGNICGTSNFKVANDGAGNLTGWAWNDGIGWISFDSASATSTYTYQVTVSPSTGDFSGWAWNDAVGWISFNCLNTSSCATSNYKVNTSWRAYPLTASLTSSIFDTGIASGTAVNTIMWQGNQPAGTSVKFQIASSNSSSGPWSYLGTDGTANTYYSPSNADIPVQINLTQHNNKRYFRYLIFLYSNVAKTLSPRVDDVIVNWSP